MGEEDACKRTRLSWKGLGTAPWLIEHLDDLGYTYPTTIPINATKRSVITILGYFEDEEDDAGRNLSEGSLNQQL